MVDSGRSARSHDPAVSECSGPAGVGSRAACRRLWSQRGKFLRRIIRSPRRRAVESIAAPERLGGKQLQPFARQCHGRDLFHQRSRGEASPISSRTRARPGRVPAGPSIDGGFAWNPESASRPNLSAHDRFLRMRSLERNDGLVGSTGKFEPFVRETQPDQFMSLH
jgi:hypothetical protein